MPGRGTILAIALLGALLAPAAAQAAPDACSFDAAGTWDDAAKWSCGHVPDADDTVTISSGDTATVTAADAVAGTLTLDTGGTLAFANGRVLDVAGATTLAAGTVSGTGRLDANGTLTKTAGELFLTGAVIDALAASFWMDGDICPQGGGRLRVTSSLTLATAADAINCADGALAIPAGGSVIVQGGTHTFAAPLDNDGVLQVEAGTLSLGGGSLDSDAGSFTVAGQLNLAAGRTLGATARLGGTGTVVQTSGITTLAAGGVLDPAVLTLQGGILSLDGAAPVPGLAQVNLDGGTFTGARDRTIANLAITSGTLSGAQTTTVDGTLAKTTAGQLDVTGALLAPSVDMTWAGGSICLQTGGTLRLTATLHVEAGAGALNCSEPTAPLDIEPGASVDYAGGPRTWSSPVVDGGTITVDAGESLTFGSLKVEPGGMLTGNGTAGGSVTNAGGIVSPDGGTLTMPGTLTQSSGLTQVSDGEALPIAGAHTQSGGTTSVVGTMSASGHAVSGGAVTVDGVLSGPTTLSGGTLGGTGQLDGDLSNTGGSVKPGDSPGILTVDGAYTQGAGGTLEVEVDGTTAGAGFDQLAVTGAASLAGTLAITHGFTPAVGATFRIVSASSRTGTFGTVTGETIDAQRSFVVEPLADGVRLVVAGPGVPVPGSPQVSGTVQVGSTVTCLEGTWQNDPEFAYAWLRDGAPIAGATARTYAIAAADAGHQLACRVTGTNVTGSAQATSPNRGVPAAVVAAPRPTPTPTPTPIAATNPPKAKPRLPLQNASPKKVAAAFGLPSARSCVSRRTFTIRLREPKNIDIRRARVLVDGKAAKVRKVKGRFTARVDLRGLRKGRFAVTIRITTADKRKLTGKRTYRTCAKQPRKPGEPLSGGGGGGGG